MGTDQNAISKSIQQPGHETTSRGTDPLDLYRQKLARVALDEMYQFVAILDASGTLLEVNRAALVGAGLKLSDVEGKPFWECYWWAVSKEIQDTLKDSIMRAAKGEFIRYDVEIYGRASGKETIIIDFSIIPVRDETGKVVYLVAEGRDITEKKAYEREIAHKNADLLALLEHIRELDEIKTQFLANVSYELRTPLTLILGPAERLMKEEDVTRRQEFAQIIVRNARILHKHVDDLLDISKFEEGKLHALPRPLVPSSTVQSETPTKSTILLVEDNPDMHAFLAQVLSSDYHVISAFDGQEGLQKALEVLPTLILTDIMMPKVSGVQMIDQIRQHPELINTPILILSAKADEDLKVKLLQQEVQDFVIKPFSEQDLLVRVHNVIKRKQAQERLQALAEIVSSSEDAILSKDLEGIITSWNPTAERLYGYSAQEIVGHPVTWIFPPDQQDEFRQIMERIRRGERVEHYETIRVRKDGTFLTVSVTVSPLKDSSGVIIGASAIARDISERIALEQQREAFVSLVTHELKTPLAVLQGNVQLAQRRLRRLLTQATSLTDEQQQTLEEVLLMLGRSQKPLRVQQRLIHDLLDLGSIQQDQMELRFAVFDLIRVVDESVQDHQAAYPSRLILLELPEQDSIPVYADQDRITQVLGNYLANALKFAPESLPVRVSIKVEAASVRVCVSDQGPGLSSEQQAHIWKRFYQISQTPLQKGWRVGLGLGLYLCQQLMHRQLGEVGVESSLGQGATFWFALPCLDENALD